MAQGTFIFINRDPKRPPLLVRSKTDADEKTKATLTEFDGTSLAEHSDRIIFVNDRGAVHLLDRDGHLGAMTTEASRQAQTNQWAEREASAKPLVDRVGHKYLFLPEEREFIVSATRARTDDELYWIGDYCDTGGSTFFSEREWTAGRMTEVFAKPVVDRVGHKYTHLEEERDFVVESKWLNGMGWTGTYCDGSGPCSFNESRWPRGKMREVFANKPAPASPPRASGQTWSYQYEGEPALVKPLGPRLKTNNGWKWADEEHDTGWGDGSWTNPKITMKLVRDVTPVSGQRWRMTGKGELIEGTLVKDQGDYWTLEDTLRPNFSEELRARSCMWKVRWNDPEVVMELISEAPSKNPPRTGPPLRWWVTTNGTTKDFVRLLAWGSIEALELGKQILYGRAEIRGQGKIPADFEYGGWSTEPLR